MQIDCDEDLNQQQVLPKSSPVQENQRHSRKGMTLVVDSRLRGNDGLMIQVWHTLPVDSRLRGNDGLMIQVWHTLPVDSRLHGNDGLMIQVMAYLACGFPPARE